MARKIPEIKVKKEVLLPSDLDNKGYVIIRLEPKDKPQKLVIEYHTYPYKRKIGRFTKQISATIDDILKNDLTSMDIIRTFVKEIPGLQPDHYAYIGREIFRAHFHLTTGESYTQDADFYVQDGCD